MNRVAHQLLQWWPSALVVAVIIYATWLPDPVGAEELPKIPHLDKLIHAVMMGGFASALMFDYHRACPGRRPLTRRVIIVFTVMGMAFGLVDETVQGLLPIGRPFDLLDVWADLAGCLIAALAAPPAIKAIFARNVR